MTGEPTDTQGLLERARGGDQSAFDELFQRHRGRLQKAIAMRIDRRLSAESWTAIVWKFGKNNDCPCTSYQDSSSAQQSLFTAKNHCHPLSD
jgi:hypothetical protein